MSPAGARGVRSLWLQSRTPHLETPAGPVSPISHFFSLPPHPKTVSDSKFLSGSCKGIRLLPGGARLSPSFQGDAFVPTDSNPPSRFTKDPCESSPPRTATAPSPPLSPRCIGVGSLPASEARGEEATGRGCPGPARGRGAPHLRRRRLPAALGRPGERRWVQACSAASRRDPAPPHHGPGACSPAARRCGRPTGAQGSLRPALPGSGAAPLRVPPGSQPEPRTGWRRPKTWTRGRAAGPASARIPRVAPGWRIPDAQ